MFPFPGLGCCAGAVMAVLESVHCACDNDGLFNVFMGNYCVHRSSTHCRVAAGNFIAALVIRRIRKKCKLSMTFLFKVINIITDRCHITILIYKMGHSHILLHHCLFVRTIRTILMDKCLGML